MKCLQFYEKNINFRIKNNNFRLSSECSSRQKLFPDIRVFLPSATSTFIHPADPHSLSTIKRGSIRDPKNHNLILNKMNYQVLLKWFCCVVLAIVIASMTAGVEAAGYGGYGGYGAGGLYPSVYPVHKKVIVQPIYKKVVPFYKPIVPVYKQVVPVYKPVKFVHVKPTYGGLYGNGFGGRFGGGYGGIGGYGR